METMRGFPDEAVTSMLSKSLWSDCLFLVRHVGISDSGLFSIPLLL